MEELLPDHRVNPCDYCAIEHGKYYFPELLKDIDPADQYKFLAMVKRYLCSSAAHIPSCDPHVCVAGLKGAKTPGQVMLASKAIWQEYYAKTYEVSGSGGAFDDILDDLEESWDLE